MENVSAVTNFILAAYTDIEDFKYTYFAGFFLLYILTILENAVLIGVICVERALHEPMYMFVCNLAVNGMYGSSSLLPSLLGHLLSQTHEISPNLCLAQVYCLHTYAIVEFTILGVMGYDRYVAICRPLHYHVIMSPRKVCALITLSWVYPLIFFGLYFILTIRLTFCGRYIQKIYCMNFEVVKLSCVDTSVHSIIGLLMTLIFILPQLIMILFSYTQILRVCLRSSKESRAKALQTCTPHLFAVINYSVGVFFEVIQSRFKMTHLSYQVRLFMSVYFLIFPPTLNPAIYGISIQSIRVRVFKILPGKK